MLNYQRVIHGKPMVVSIILIYGLNMGYKDIIWYDDLEVLRYI